MKVQPNFQPIQVNFYGNGCKIVNYTNLKSSPAFTIPKDSRGGWLTNNAYPPAKPSTAKFKTDAQYTELYNTREQYINESKRQKAPCYSFGKAGIKEDEFYVKTKIKKRPKSSKNKKIYFDEENIGGDNCENNLTNNEKEEKFHQYYEVGTKYVNESRKPRAPLYSFAGGKFGEDYLTKRKIDNNFFSQNDFYETRKYYVNESKKPRILGYSFAKEKRIDPNIKKKWKYKIYGNNDNKNITFKEENNFENADNNQNIKETNNNEKEDKNENKKKNKDKKTNIINNNSNVYPHDFYNVREHYIYESKKPRVVGYSFGKTSGVKPKIIEGKKGKEPFFYNLREHYIYESQKPQAPNYSFGRPRSFISSKKNKNKKYKLRPESAVFKNNLKNQIEEEEKNQLKSNIKINKVNGPGPGSYKIEKNLGENALKISMSPVGRKYPRSNGFPGPNYYRPKYNFVKRKYPNYSIGNAERECYEGYYPINNSMNNSYGSQYYRRNPSWVIAKNCRGEIVEKIKKQNLRYL